MRIHIVKKGDTLWKIAKEYGISFEDLKRLNMHLANPDYIVPGMEIILPEKGSKEMPVQKKPTVMPHKKEEVKKEIVKERPVPPPVVPMPIPIPIPPPPPPPQPMPPIIVEPQLIQMPPPQAPIMWVQQPVEVSWHQQLLMPQMEQPIAQPVAPPVVQPPPPPPPVVHPQMPMYHHCPSCQQPVMHAPMMPMCPTHQMHQMHQMHPMHQPMHPMHQMYPMHPMHQPMHYPMQHQECDMPAQVHCEMPEVGGAHQPLFFLESTSSSSSSSCHDKKDRVQHYYDQVEAIQGAQPYPDMCPPMGGNVGGMYTPQWNQGHQWHQNPCNCPPPHFFPGGMTPYR